MSKNTNDKSYNDIGRLYEPKYNPKAYLEGEIRLDPEEAKEVIEKLQSGKGVYLSVWKFAPKREDATIDHYYTLSLGNVKTK